MRVHEAEFADAHTIARHGPDVPLSDLEARIYGNPPWPRPENWSYRWDNVTTMNDVTNEYLQRNWDTIRTDLLTKGHHRVRFDAGRRVGRGYYNSGMYGAGQRQAEYDETSWVQIAIELAPGGDPRIFIPTTFPTRRPLGPV
ncbi:MAG: hypothetical protein ACRDI2_22560, partial [Chloroflexota bacterium]